MSTKKSKLSNTSFKKCRTLKKIKFNINKRKLISEFKIRKNLNESNDVNYEIKSHIENSTKETKHSKHILVPYKISTDNTKEKSVENTTNNKYIDVTSDSGSEYVPSDEQIESGEYYY